MNARHLLFIITTAVGCNPADVDNGGVGAPTLTVVDTSFSAKGNWQVMGADVDSSGRVFIADFSTLGVYVGERPGTVSEPFGRAGDGPGEFRYLHGLRRCGSIVVAYDFVHSRLTPVTRDGLGKDEELPIALRFSDFIGCDARGRRYFTRMTDGRVSPGRHRKAITLFRHAPQENVIDTMATLPGTEIFVSDRWHAFRELPFGFQTLVTVAPRGVVYAENSRMELYSIDEMGRRESLYSATLDQRDVTERDRQLYLEERLQWEPDSAGRATLRRVLEEAQWESRVPLLDRLIAGHDGTIWVRRTPAPADTTALWLAVDQNGQNVESVLLPRPTRVMSAGRGFLTIVDDLASGEERVMVVRFIRKQ